jgi:hypothetical protein
VDLGRDIPIALSAEDERRDLRFSGRQSEALDDTVPVVGRRSEAAGGRGPLQHSPEDDHGSLFRAGALKTSLVASGEWWRLLTCVFVHIGVIHVLFNLSALLSVASFALLVRAR